MNYMNPVKMPCTAVLVRFSSKELVLLATLPFTEKVQTVVAHVALLFNRKFISRITSEMKRSGGGGTQ